MVLLSLYLDNSLAYFQIRMGPIQSCIEFMVMIIPHNFVYNYSTSHLLQDTTGSSKDNLDNIRRGLSEELIHLCPTCGLTAANIKEDEFSCRGGLTKQIVYRGRIVGTEVYSATGLISLIQSWVASGRASLMIQSSRLHLDPSCDVALDTLKSPDCPPKDVTVTNAQQSVVGGGGASVGEIGGIVVGGVIIALLAILIVILAVFFISRRKSGKRFVQSTDS